MFCLVNLQTFFDPLIDVKFWYGQGLKLTLTNPRLFAILPNIKGCTLESNKPYDVNINMSTPLSIIKIPSSLCTTTTPRITPTW
jgi:hypothetical protein